MANSVANGFSDVGASRVSAVKGVPVLLGDYGELPAREDEHFSILFLSSDSGAKIKRAVERGSKAYVKGAFSQFKKNVKDLSQITCDDHLKDSIVKSYKAGGDMALSVMLGLAEEEHAIQSVCDMCECVSLEKYANVRLSEVAKRIAENKPDVFHFSGHLDKDKGLAFCHSECADSSGVESDFMDERSLVGCFKEQKVQLAVIASCNSASYAKALVESKVAEMAIGSTNSVEDLETIRFVQIFYNELAKLVARKDQGLQSSIQKAFSAAGKSVRSAKCQMQIFPEAAKVPAAVVLGDNTFNSGAKGFTVKSCVIEKNEYDPGGKIG